MSQVNFVVFASGGWDRSAQGTAGAARRLADSLGTTVRAIALGPADDALKAGLATAANDVQIVAAATEYQPEAALTAVAQLSEGAAAVLLGNDTYSQEIAPRLAHRLGGASMADAQQLEVVDGKIHVTRSAYGGKALAVYEMEASPAVIWVRSRALEPVVGDVGGAVSDAAVDLGEPKLTIVERNEEASEGVSLEEASVIVSGGRGLGGPEPFEEMLAPLAEAMGAVQGASRAACDAGWVPPNWQVGQTGKKVAPELYLAIAISGASQHLLGMGDSKTVAAINTDPDAPIFKHCSFGIVEDYKNVVPLLTEKLKALQS